MDEKSNLELRIKRINEIKNILNKTYELDNNEINTLEQNEYEIIKKLFSANFSFFSFLTPHLVELLFLLYPT